MSGKDNRVWRSLVSRLNGVQEALSSNLSTRTKSSENHLIWVIFGTFFFDFLFACFNAFPVAVSQSSRSTSVSTFSSFLRSMPPHSRYGKAPACSLDKPGQDGIMETERALLPRLAHQMNYFYADRLGATKRSARFYGEYVGRKGQAYKKLPEEVSHTASPPFAGKWLTAVYVTAPLSDPFRGTSIIPCRAADCQFSLSYPCLLYTSDAADD